MSYTPRQNRERRTAAWLRAHFGESPVVRKIDADVKRVEKRKRRQHRGKKP